MSDYEMMSAREARRAESERDVALKRAEAAEHELNEWRRGDVDRANLAMADRCIIAERQTFDLHAKLTTARAELAEARAMSDPGGRWRLAERSVHMEEAAQLLARHIADCQCGNLNGEDVGVELRALARLPPTLRAVPVEVLAQVREALLKMWAPTSREGGASLLDWVAHHWRPDTYAKVKAQSVAALAALEALGVK